MSIETSFNFTDRTFFINFTEKKYFIYTKGKFKLTLLRENPFSFNWKKTSFKFSNRNSFHFVDRENLFLLNLSIRS